MIRDKEQISILTGGIIVVQRVRPITTQYAWLVFFLKEEEETATIPHAKLRFTYRQMEISDTCILWGLARLHTLRGIRVWTWSPGNVLSHHFIISLTSAQDENRLSRCDLIFLFFIFAALVLQKNPSSEAQKPKTLWGALGFIVEWK